MSRPRNMSERLARKPACRRSCVHALLHKHLAFSLVLLATAVLSPWRGLAQNYESGEYDLKAAILFNLVKFVEWPPTSYPDARAPTVVCTLGKEPFGPALDRFASTNSVFGRQLTVRRLQREEDSHGCHLIYISSSERKLLPDILKGLEGSHVLTVGETEQFAAHGGMVQLTMEDKQVHFTINLGVASREELRIRSGLLALSKIIGSGAIQRTENGLAR
jgi:hypothetical protein